MKPITFTGSGMLAGLATMLELLGHDTTDRQIALDMEAPYLLAHTNAGYQSGISLYTPQWLNLSLHRHGFHLTCEHLQQKDVASFLRTHHPAMLRLCIKPGVSHPLVFSSYEEKRYHFINIKPINSDEPDDFSFSAPSLLRRLEEEVDVYHITPHPPEEPDFLPLLRASLDNLSSYQEELLAVRKQEITLDEFKALRGPLFRALMQDLYPLICLTDDDDLAESLRKLNHHYRHIFTVNSGKTVVLADRLPKKLIVQCITWLREDILDRIYEHGGDDDDV